jgi:hypothetical protein
VKVRSEIVGHSGTRTTEQIYDHADTEDFAPIAMASDKHISFW